MTEQKRDITIGLTIRPMAMCLAIRMDYNENIRLEIFADILSDVVRIPFSKSYLLPSRARSSKWMDAGAPDEIFDRSWAIRYARPIWVGVLRRLYVCIY